MPTSPPPTDGLPPWAQITLSLIFLMVAVAALLRGYLKDGSPPEVTQTAAAHMLSAQIADMGAIRDLTDTCKHLIVAVKDLEEVIRDQAHYTRNMIEAHERRERQSKGMLEIVEQLMREQERGRGK